MNSSVAVREAPGGGLRKPPSYLEEEVEAKQSAAGDDGKPGRVSTGDGLWHVRSILGGEMKQNDSDVSAIM